jgi:hypothetical protein
LWVDLAVSHFNLNKEMIKKLLVVITFAALVVACGDKKKNNVEEPKIFGVEALIESENEVTLIGKLGICPVSQEDVVLAGKGAFVKVVLAEGVELDETLIGGGASVTGTLSAIVLDEEAIAELEARFAEVKEKCCAKKAAEEGAENAEPKKCCKEKEGEKCCKDKEGKEKSCCSAPKLGDKIFILTATKIEKFECPNKGKCCKEGEKSCEKKDGEKCCKEKEDAKCCEKKAEEKTAE